MRPVEKHLEALDRSVRSPAREIRLEIRGVGRLDRQLLAQHLGERGGEGGAALDALLEEQSPARESLLGEHALAEGVDGRD